MPSSSCFTNPSLCVTTGTGTGMLGVCVVGFRALMSSRERTDGRASSDTADGRVTDGQDGRDSSKVNRAGI